MRSVGLDLGVRHIAYCEVKDGKVVDRGAVRSFSQLASRLGPKSAAAEVGFEACREGWHVHDTLKKWGHKPRTRAAPASCEEAEEKNKKHLLRKPPVQSHHSRSRLGGLLNYYCREAA
jgi:hypothetical protein